MFLHTKFSGPGYVDAAVCAPLPISIFCGEMHNAYILKKMVRACST